MRMRICEVGRATRFVEAKSIDFVHVIRVTLRQIPLRNFYYRDRLRSAENPVTKDNVHGVPATVAVI